MYMENITYSFEGEETPTPAPEGDAPTADPNTVQDSELDNEDNEDEEDDDEE